METTVLIAIAAGILVGLLVGGRVARRSMVEAPIHGGMGAHLLHRVACTALPGGLPAGLVGIFVGRNVLLGLALAFGFVGVSLAALLIFGVLERMPRALAEAQDRGWTAEKARSSGL